jgi:hypothetical protein
LWRSMTLSSAFPSGAAAIGVRVPVEPQVFEVLAYLVNHRNRVVAKEELMDRVWVGVRQRDCGYQPDQAGAAGDWLDGAFIDCHVHLGRRCAVLRHTAEEEIDMSREPQWSGAGVRAERRRGST